MIKFTEHKAGKLEFLASLSTSFADFCFKAQLNPDNVCFECYGINHQKCFKSMVPFLERNTKHLTKRIPFNEIPILNYKTVRFNSFGEIHNKNHLANLVKIAEKNPTTQFTLWTKRYNITEGYFNGHKKPDNFILIYSSMKVNKALDVDKYSHNDKVFTVYSKDQNVNINCGGRKCATCMLCYTYNKTKYVNEHLK